MSKTFLFVCAFALLMSNAFAQTELTPEEQEALRVSEIRGYILSANSSALISVLSNITNVETVALGFRYEPEDEEAFTVTTASRVSDPDVICIQAFASAVLSGADSDLLAQVWLQTQYLESSTYVSDSALTYQRAFESFSNPEEMQSILDADPTAQPLPSAFAPAPAPAGRRLLVRSEGDIASPLCSKCYEQAFCKKNAPWC